MLFLLPWPPIPSAQPCLVRMLFLLPWLWLSSLLPQLPPRRPSTPLLLLPLLPTLASTPLLPKLLATLVLQPVVAWSQNHALWMKTQYVRVLRHIAADAVPPRAGPLDFAAFLGVMLARD